MIFIKLSKIFVYNYTRLFQRNVRNFLRAIHDFYQIFNDFRVKLYTISSTLSSSPKHTNTRVGLGWTGTGPGWHGLGWGRNGRHGTGWAGPCWSAWARLGVRWSGAGCDHVGGADWGRWSGRAGACWSRGLGWTVLVWSSWSGAAGMARVVLCEQGWRHGVGSCHFLAFFVYIYIFIIISSKKN